MQEVSLTSLMGALLRHAVPSALLVIGALACGGHGRGPTKAELSHPLVGRPAPAFVREQIVGGEPFDLGRAQGKAVVVTFWATWCEPCKKAFPQLQKLAEKYQGKIEIVGVCEDDGRAGIEEFIDTYDGKFNMVWDDRKKIAGKWQPKTLPASFVLDRRGVVRSVHLGYDDGQDAELETELKTLL